MKKAIFYKEWIKTKRVVLLLTILVMALLSYLFLSISSDFRANGAVEIWGAAIAGRYSIIARIIYFFPLIAGLLLGMLQFTSEITSKRLKLTLHLPLNESKIMAIHYLYGVAIVLGFSILLFGVSLSVLSAYFPCEILAMTLPMIAVNVMLGVVLYFASAYVVLEPVWRRRVGAILVSIGAVWSFFLGGMPNCCGLLFLLLLTALMVVAAYLSASRFKDGAQN